MAATRYAPLLLAALLPACATKGNIQEAIDAQAARNAAAIEAERSARERDHAALEAAIASSDGELESRIVSLESDMAALRSDLQAMRDDFGARITAAGAGLQFAMPIHFGFDEATVRAQDRAALERFTAVVNEYYTGALVTIEGFTDPAGPEEYNMMLSEYRAEAVRDQLVALGIQAELRAVGYGESRPVVEDAAASAGGAELNRRVVFVIERP